MADDQTLPNDNAHPVTSRAAHLRAPKTRSPQAAVDQAPEAGRAGKGGEAGAPPIALTNSDFLAVVFRHLPDGAHAAVAAKAGDPGQGGWQPHDAVRVEAVCEAGLNNYFNCSSFHAAADGSIKARKDCAAAYHALVLDDVGTKAGQPPIGVTPTWALETSEGNFQLGFVLAQPETSSELIEDAQQAVAGAGLCDAGALGLARWVRLPNGVNGKAKHRDERGSPFQCRLTEWNPDVEYDLEDLVDRLVPDRTTQPARVPVAGSPRQRLARNAVPGISPEVFIPASPENPVVAALKTAGLHKTEKEPGKHDITCPWVAEHTGPDNGACFFEPSRAHPLGGFKCHHSHSDRYKLKDLLELFELNRSDVRNRPRIRTVEGELESMVNAAQLVLADTGQYFQAGGLIVKVGTDPVTGGVGLVPQTDADLTLALSGAAEWERYDKSSPQNWVRTNPQPNVIRLLLQMQTYDHLPALRGIARQPMLGRDGRLVTASGYDPRSQLYCAFEGAAFKRAEPTEANARAALGRLSELLREFRFATPRDKATALAAMFTAALRPGLGRAPAFHIRAPSPGSGKSLLSDVIARFAGAGHPAKVSYPRSEEEATKVLLAALIEAPAVIDFDDMALDWRPFGAVNRLLTSPTMTDRILGVSKMATVSTDVLVLGSGNNTGPTGDLCRRVVVIDLDTGDESPVTIRYEGDPLAAVEANREAYVADVLTVVEAWLAAGSPKSDISPLASYGGRWSELCRQPLVWLGLDDPAEGLIEQLRDDPDVVALGRLLHAWHARLASKPVTLRVLVADAEGDLLEALEDLPFVEGGPVNKMKLGHYLKRNCGRPVGGLRLEKAESRERNAWRVVEVGGSATLVPPPSPGLPASNSPREGQRSFD
ncbi:hypothetical protein GRI40_06045 [Altererythrobacter aerius]|uniref:RepB-like DNA primase domain-containing protein n=1 Tax=Tsuneonella aeria TaxID=1837929 RepID=A0A6I4TBR6_9SPHN|nr:DNA-primase RepB domain-containing protein [Tsuneonella aeria]MXO74781.1 hypothetical protein [Tsuneonella aeria]